MSLDFLQITDLLKNNDYENFEKELKNYLSASDGSKNIEELKKNYILLSKTLFDKLDEFQSDENNYQKVFDLILTYLEKKDYNNPSFWYNTGVNFQNLRLNSQAIKCYMNCMKFKNFDIDVFRCLGDMFCENIPKKAIKFYEKYIKYVKNNHAVYNMLGHLYEISYKSKYVDKQINYFEAAHRLAPFDRQYLTNLAIVTGKNKDIKRFCRYSEKLIKNNPTYREKFDFACWSMYNKLFKNVYKYYHNRFFLEDNPVKYPNINEKLWNGKDIIRKDKTLLVRYEQGFGDSLCFVRLLPLLQKIVPAVVFEAQNELLSLFQYNYPDTEIISDYKEKIDYDYQIPLLDLITVLKINDKNIPQKDGYLKVSEEKTKEFAEKYIKTDKFKIGIAYKGETDYFGENRDIPENILVNLTKLNNVQVYSLQTENKEDLFKLPESKNIIDLGDALTDFEQTACAMKNMDLIICTDNVILNLAGAMGLKTFGLFNYYTDFRWFNLDNNDTGWYNSIKVYKAKEHNNWQDLFEKVIKDTEKLIN